MFEGTLVESRGLAGTGIKQWTALGSIALQCGIAGALMVIPLPRPEVLPLIVAAPRLVIPLPRTPTPPVVRVQRMEASSSAAAMSVPVERMVSTPMMHAILPSTRGVDYGTVPPMATTLGPGFGTTGVPNGLGLGDGAGSGPSIAVAPARAVGPARISAGVVTGMLIGEIKPVYPRIAVATRTEGMVVMEAVISKAGTIESLHVVSGPEMLRRAALDAVQVARYTPYRLNGELTEVQTRITVVFRLGS
jgi:protein TonB